MKTTIEIADDLLERARRLARKEQTSFRALIVFACFLVMGPEFTTESALLAMQYQVQNGITVTLITAEELKSLAEEWNTRDPKTSEIPFPLGYLVQPGRYNRNLVALT